MFCSNLLSRLCGGLAFAGVAGLHLADARADDRVQPGSMKSMLVEFQSQVGDRVFFGDASAELGSRGRMALEAQAAWLARRPTLAVLVEGHADDAGASSHNFEMSQQRADIVRRRLIQMGVAPERIRTVAYGRDRLVADCPAPACGAQNRRAVTVIVPTFGQVGGEPPRDTAARRSARRLN
jgi:peptidoglycan-associated lipoprotein